MISKEEKKIILRRKALPKYYISLKDMFPTIYNFIKRDLKEKLNEENTLCSDIIYDYKNENIWITEDLFNQNEDIFIGYIQNETFEAYKQVIDKEAKFTKQAYLQYLCIRTLSVKELKKYIKKYKKYDTEAEEILYYYCKYERLSRIPFVWFYGRAVFCFKFATRYFYHKAGREKFFDKTKSYS